jgi:hypothetical protein
MAYQSAGSQRRPHRHIMPAWRLAKAPAIQSSQGGAQLPPSSPITWSAAVSTPMEGLFEQ